MLRSLRSLPSQVLRSSQRSVQPAGLVRSAPAGTDPLAKWRNDRWDAQFLIILHPAQEKLDLKEYMKVFPAHLAYAQGWGKDGRIVQKGPFLLPDGEENGGGMFVVKTNTYEEALSFAKNDPLVLAGFLRADVHIWAKEVQGLKPLGSPWSPPPGTPAAAAMEGNSKAAA